MKIVLSFLLVYLCIIQVNTALAQNNIERDVNQLERRINNLEHDLSGYASSTYILFLTGVVCALWAQNTGRNAWLWFFLGCIFSAITLIVLLIKNYNDKFEDTNYDP